MNKLICVSIFLAGLFLSECKTTTVSTSIISAAPVVTTSDTLAMAISNGQTLYQTKCYRCHDLPVVSEYSRSEWSYIMIKMSRKAHLSEDETSQVLTYIGATTKQ